MIEGGARGWTVHPERLGSGTLDLPGDKSITHRAYLLGLLADGVTEVESPNPGADAEATLAAAERLGAGIERNGANLRITGTAATLGQPSSDLDCGNSGTSLRLLAGVLAGQPIHAVLTGDDSLKRRPVDRVITPLRAMGATLSGREGDRFPPLEIRGGALRGVEFEAPTGSAQVASAILFAGLAARGTTSVATRAGVRDHTRALFSEFGVEVEAAAEAEGTRRLRVRGPGIPRAARVRVPGDPSAAAFFLAAAAATPGAHLTARGVNLHPARLGLLNALTRMGAAVRVEAHGEAAGEPVGDVTIVGPEALVATDLVGAELPAMIDEVPAWAVAAAVARGTSRLRGGAELRIKESDRIGAIAANLRALGVEAREVADGLDITGGRPRGGSVEARGDHRIAMAFAMLGSLAEETVIVDDASSVTTSFPGFAACFRSLGGRLEERNPVGRTT